MTENIMSYLLNLLMMVPLGLLLPLIWSEFRSWKKVALIGFFLSLAIELSQLLNVRATTTEDVITNTLGAVVGYLIFKVLGGKILGKRIKTLEKTEEKSCPSILRNEAVWYLVLSFMGMFLFYNPMAKLGGPSYEMGESVIVITNSDGEIMDEKRKVEGEDFWNGFVREISDDVIAVEKLEVFESEKGIIRITTDEVILVSVGGAIFEIWQASDGEVTEPIILSATVGDLRIRDNLEIYGRYEGGGFVAEKVVIFR